MKDNEIEFGKYYELDCNRKYFSIDLQREVQFDGVLAVKPMHNDSAFGNFNGGCSWFGTLVNVDVNRLHDYDTNNEIEFVAEDVISEYEFKDKILPFIVPI